MADAPSDAIPGITAKPVNKASPKDATGAAKTALPNASSAAVPFSDFSKLDLRVGKILSAVPVEGASKLYRLEVDIGTETRTLVGGLVGSYSGPGLVGRLVAVVCNLERKVIRGVESQGMMLAADDNGNVALLAPDKPVAPGSKIR